MNKQKHITKHSIHTDRVSYAGHDLTVYLWE